MTASKFLDTNILLYAYDRDAPAKRDVALRLVERGWSSPGRMGAA
jgi:predicted nucleic acid-binding protein